MKDFSFDKIHLSLMLLQALVLEYEKINNIDKVR